MLLQYRRRKWTASKYANIIRIYHAQQPNMGQWIIVVLTYLDDATERT